MEPTAHDAPTASPAATDASFAVPVVAIDGPAASGKSTVAKLVAKRLDFAHLDTGAMYRCVALTALRDGVDLGDADALGTIAERSNIDIADGTVRLNGDDVSRDIRTVEVSAAVSVIAVHPSVRAPMRDLQRRWAAQQVGVVAEGRDMGTVVFPDAAVKVYLTATPLVRARRRLGERDSGEVEHVAAEIAERDERDANRADSPMKPAADAVMIDTSDLSIADVVGTITALVANR